jgi:hypothetical protein
MSQVDWANQLPQTQLILTILSVQEVGMVELWFFGVPSLIMISFVF